MRTGMLPFYAAVACGALAAGVAYVMTKRR
jgi:hypothetical protein